MNAERRLLTSLSPFSHAVLHWQQWDPLREELGLTLEVEVYLSSAISNKHAHPIGNFGNILLSFQTEIAYSLAADICQQN